MPRTYRRTKRIQVEEGVFTTLTSSSVPGGALSDLRCASDVGSGHTDGESDGGRRTRETSFNLVRTKTMGLETVEDSRFCGGLNYS